MESACFYVVIRGLVHSVHPDFEEARMTMKSYLARWPNDVKRISVMRKTTYYAVKERQAAIKEKQAELPLDTSKQSLLILPDWA